MATSTHRRRRTATCALVFALMAPVTAVMTAAPAVADEKRCFGNELTRKCNVYRVPDPTDDDQVRVTVTLSESRAVVHGSVEYISRGWFAPAFDDKDKRVPGATIIVEQCQVGQANCPVHASAHNNFAEYVRYVAAGNPTFRGHVYRACASWRDNENWRRVYVCTGWVVVPT